MNINFKSQGPILILALLMTIATVQFCFANGFSGYHYIEKINQRECTLDKGLEITFIENHTNPDSCCTDQTNCANTPSRIIEIPCDQDNYTAVLTISTAAALAEKKVAFWVSGCDSEGNAYGKTINLMP